ncbi:unnamed protein product [Porites evermanni]|uniref:Uncharacterized protein n=1 Tax=Porites evermanni TaxID=104178 RepID=A0ABN8QWR2_9CNID|nr:unnamed protein product [Porites evermanni]
MDTSETGTETSTSIASTTGLTNRPRNQHKNCRFIRLAPLICVFVGCSLTVVGQVASQKSCEIAGPVVIAMGGLLLIFLTFWDSRNKLTDGTCSGEEEVVNTPQTFSNKCLNTDEAADLGSIHHFEIFTPTEESVIEMVPPSYEIAVGEKENISK